MGISTGQIYAARRDGYASGFAEGKLDERTRFGKAMVGSNGDAADVLMMDDAPSSDGIHLTPEQRLSLLETFRNTLLGMIHT